MGVGTQDFRPIQPLASLGLPTLLPASGPPLLALGPGQNPLTVVSFRPVVTILPKGRALPGEQKHLETTVVCGFPPPGPQSTALAF